MSAIRSLSWTSATRDMRSDRAARPAGFITALSAAEFLARTRPLVVAGAYDRSAIMAAAVFAAKAHQLRTGSTWGAAMSVALSAAWAAAKGARARAAN